MKKLVLVVFAAMMCSVCFAQNNAISKYFSTYQKDKDFTKLSVTSKMFSLFTEIDAEDPDEQELLEAMSKIKGIKAIFNDKSDQSSKLYYDAIDKASSDGSYEELMTIEDAEENVMFMISDNNGIINELLMIVGGNNNFMVMTVYGEIDLSQIARLARVLNIKGMEQFRALEKKEKAD